MFERQVQLISCAGDKSVLVWSLRKPSADDDDDEEEMMDEQMQPAKGGDFAILPIDPKFPVETASSS